MSLYIRAVRMFRFLTACVFGTYVCALSSVCACVCVVQAKCELSAHASQGTVLNFMALADNDILLFPPVSFHLCWGW